jgi:RNA polymerase sigma factor (sigma-70 family)
MASVLPPLTESNCRAFGAATPPTDPELLRRFLAGDEAAFLELVQRHARLVSSACQHVLRNTDDADDAFQATFLVLARKARSLRWQESIAGWLYETARRTSLKLQATTARRREVEELAAQKRADAAATSAADPATQASLHELVDILDAELASLPLRFREVILLNQVEGLTRDEVAKRLGISIGAVKDRLERGREQLRSRLLRRGITLTAATLAAWLVPGTTQAAIATVAASTAQAAVVFATGSLPAGTTLTAVTLAQGILKMMGLQKLKCIAVCIASVLTAGGIAFGMLQDEPTRFEKGLLGEIASVNAGNPTTVTISLDEFGTLLNLDVSPKVKVWTAFESGQLADLKKGQFVSLRLGNDHRTVNEVHVQGQIREGSIKSLAASGKITLVEDDDDEGDGNLMEVDLAPDAILRIGGLPATRGDLKPGMEVPLEFGRDGKLVNAIEAEAAEHSVIEGELLEVNADTGKINVYREEGPEGQPIQQSFTITADTIIWLDDRATKLVDLKPFASILLRLSDDGRSVRAIRAKSPEPDDDEEESDD